MKVNNQSHFFQLILATFCISTSGALGKYIDLPTPVVIWWRAILAALLLFLFCKYKKFNLKLNSKKDWTTIIASALLFCGHWIFYFYALKLSNVAIGMLALFTYPIFSALLEPLLLKTKFDVTYLFLGILVLLGIYTLAPEFNLESAYTQGILFGIASAICLALRNILSKKLIASYNASAIMLYQISIIAIILAPILFFMDTSAIKTEFPYVIILALITTAIGHTLLVSSLKYFSVSTASIINSIQPIFGIIIAYLFLNEIPANKTLIGGCIILFTVVFESFRAQKKAKLKSAS